MYVVAISFLVVFILMLFAVSIGLKVLDARRKQQMAGMLDTAAGEPVVTISSLLKEIDSEQPTRLNALVASLQFSKHMGELLQQAGMTWPATRLLG